MKKSLILALVALPPLLLAGVYAALLLNEPHMKEQPHIRSFQAILPPLPPGAVPTGAPAPLPTAAEAARLVNPLQPSAVNVQRGAIYYRYYCVFCHGVRGDGRGPVGESYVPAPADLRSPKVATYRDGELLRAMLTGPGHDPVLQRVVPPEHRWYLVLFLKTFARRS